MDQMRNTVQVATIESLLIPQYSFYFQGPEKIHK